MKKTTFLFTIISIVFSTNVSLKKHKKYEIELIQNGIKIDIKDTIATLKKEPFKIKIPLFDHDGVYMSSSFNRDYFNLMEEDEIKDYQWLPMKVRAEKDFNIDKELGIDNETFAYMFYDKKKDWHRFDKEVIVNKKTVIGTKSIEKLCLVSTQKIIDIKKVDKPIYLFFLATSKNKKNKIPKELGRVKIKLAWTNE